MKKWLVAAMTLLGAGTGLAFDVNKDLKNLAGPALGICVELCGSETITETFDGYGGGPYKGTFGAPSVTTNAAGNTVICWTGFKDGGNNVIDHGQVVHVGWSTADGNSRICDMYYTDGNGNRLPDSKIENITPKFPPVNPGPITVTWENFNSQHLVFIQQVSFVVVPAPLPLADLNILNESLNSLMTPLPGGSFALAPGQSLPMPLPAVPPGGAIILRYQVSGPGSSTDAIDFVQWTNAPVLACLWDLNNDGIVNQPDLGILLAGYGTQYNQGDLGALLSVYGQTCT